MLFQPSSQRERKKESANQTVGITDTGLLNLDQAFYSGTTIQVHAGGRSTLAKIFSHISVRKTGYVYEGRAMDS